jgi:DNA-binding transcriptional MocR family regulator
MSGDERIERLRAALAARFAVGSPREFANAAAGPLFGGAGDWDLPADVVPARELMYLAVGIPDAATMPRAALADAASAVLARPGDLALRYGFGKGPTAIRDWLAARRCGQERIEVDAEWFQLTNGSSGAIDLVVRSLIDPGDVIVAEDPTYMGTLHNFRGVRADVRTVPVDQHGLDTDALAQLLRQLATEGRRVKLIYTISAFHNPTGVTLTLERRVRLLELAAQYGVLVLDDEAYRDLWYDDRPPPALSALAAGNGVITTGTFSKTVATGLRIGWIHAHPQLLALFGRMRFAMGQNQLGLRVFSEFLGGGRFEPHLESVRALYRAKRDRLHAALVREVADYLEWTPPGGGFYLWAKLRQGGDARALWRAAVAEGIAVNPGTGFSAERGTHAIRIAFSWTPADQFEEAARRLRLACERVASGATG